jgi:hypothetical protein
LSFLEFKAQVNVDLKNKRHDLKLLIESGVGRPDDCELENWETIKWHIASEAKQGKAAGIVPCRHLSPLQVTLVVVERCEGPLGVDSNQHKEKRGWTPRYHNMK